MGLLDYGYCRSDDSLVFLFSIFDYVIKCLICGCRCCFIFKFFRLYFFISMSFGELGEGRKRSFVLSF